MNRVLILGGGFGGVAAAHHLRPLLDPADEIVLVDRRTHFSMGFRKNAEIVGRDTIEAGRRPLAALARRGVQVVHGAIERIHADAPAADVDGKRITADAMLVALGAVLAPEAVPGFVEHAISVYDGAAVPAAAKALAAMDGGRLVVGVFGVPYKCPPAPYELAILAREAASNRGVALEVEAFTPQPMSLPVLGQAGCDVLDGHLADAGIAFHPNAKPARIEPGRVLLEGGGAIPFDVLFGVAPHRSPAIVVEAGLAGPGAWVPVNPSTLETGIDGVWAVGDVTAIPMANGQPLPKAGVFAEEEARVAAERIASRLTGRSTEAVFEGEGHCFLEVGGGRGVLVRGKFLAQPAPQVELTGASPDHLEEKAAFERERLDAWFGPG